MKLSDYRKLKLSLLLSCSAALFFFVGVKQSAQTQQQLPARTGHVNDLAGVVDEGTRRQLENILDNVAEKTGIQFAIATVESTGGQDIFDFSKQLARDWKIGALSSSKKSLLLVLAVKEKTSFTQFSRSAQGDLPEGVLGEMSQRMRALVNAGQFGEGLNAGVKYFVDAIAEKLALNPADFDQPSSKSLAKVPTADRPLSKPAVDPGPPATPVRPATTEPTRTTVTSSLPPNENVATKTSGPGTSVEDEDESEEVELTLTLPLEARIAKLKAFLADHPDSKSRARATELLVSAHAALGDERLRKGDSVGGIEQLTLAIAGAPINSSDKLFSGVISQIPLNLFLRGERAAATKAAESIEAKFGSDPKRLLAVSGFYIGTEQGAEAARVASRAVSLAPDMAEAHQALGLALHISLRLEEAVSEYKRALELDPNSKGLRRSVADLNRASGKSEEALALYRQQLVGEPSDKAARAGLVLALLDLGRTDEAKSELETGLKDDPRNLALLSGAAYWFAAHNDSEMALQLGSKAVEIEPRYTWSQVALARALIAQKQPLEAERAIRFARLYGKFPTLDYELASALLSAGLYDEAAEILMQSFSLKDGQVEARLGGHALARSANFTDLLAPERRASIFQSVAADSENNAKTLKALLAFASLINQEDGVERINEESAVAAAKEFASGDDEARVHRQLYAASRLLQKGIGFQTAHELAEAARNSADAGMNVPALTVVIQADEYREIRARAIAAGGTPDIPDAPRNVLSNLLRGRIEDISGWALFNQDKLDEAVDHLRRAVSVLPEGTPLSRTSLWHLGAALERVDKKEEALSYYIKSYNAGEPDSIRRTVIERLYRQINGSLEGLEERIGSGAATTAAASSNVTIEPAPIQPSPSPESTPTETPTAVAPVAEASATPLPDAQVISKAEPSPSPEVLAPPTPEPTPVAPPSPAASPEATPAPAPPLAAAPEPSPSPSSTVTPETPPVTSPPLAASPVETMDKPLVTVVTIKGRVKDSSNNPMANVVVVLISSQGTVLASTTDDEGNYSFNVAPSTHGYRVIPSKDGFTFQPADRVLPAVSESQKDMDFVGAASPTP